MKKVEGGKLKVEGERSSFLVLRSSLLRVQTKNQEPRTKNASHAFTLIELVSVLAIIVVLMSIAVGAYFSWTRMTGIDAAANLTATIFSHARELAITQRVDTQVTCLNFAPPGRPPGGLLSVYAFDTNATACLAMPTNALPAGICFRSAAEQALPSIEFHPVGTCLALNQTVVSNGCAIFTLDSTAGDASRRLTRVVEVNQLSGRIRVRREDEP